ncbi:hypothetical protein FEM48_Zijuj02G0009000 [Ziziphus jujuba var. spinosa]|uniref:U-box domain-containing protein n=1 Tax=Ziziphus jujuba var. spinosa TaxID=714518 RepID=A0A978VSN3_ZIZJJ|nr:hypothetical protein FEM48_Zijuj02G0009000 [Ziziphus jujuba var. spinosa]
MEVMVEPPKYFVCPISLQLMKDPVTAETGITYDRESIERWFLTANNLTCPVTKQTLRSDSDLTPNHTLRRLIQSWCTLNATNGVDRIPTPKSPLNNTLIFKLINDLSIVDNDDYLKPEKALKKMEALANESDRNRKCMAEAGVAKAMVLFLERCCKQGTTSTMCLQQALKVLHLVWNHTPEIKLLVNEENTDFLQVLMWILQSDHKVIRTEAMLVLKMAIQDSNRTRLERLNPELFKSIVKVLRDKVAVKSALEALIKACTWRANRLRIVEAGAVFELIETELLTNPEKHTTELIFNLLAQLCSIAEGREQLSKHAGGIAMVSKSILRVSPATDDRAVLILSMIAKFSARNEVVLEMLWVGAVTKLCMVMQAECAAYLKEKAREILRLHSKLWKDSPCIVLYLRTRNQR